MLAFSVAEPISHLPVERVRLAGGRVAVYVRDEEHGWPGLWLFPPGGGDPEEGPEVHGDFGGHLDLSADGTRLVAVADPGDRWQVFDRVGGGWKRRQAGQTRIWPDADQYGLLRPAVSADGRTVVCWGNVRGRAATGGRAEVWRVSSGGRPNRLANPIVSTRLPPVGGAAVSGGEHPVLAVWVTGKPPAVRLWAAVTGEELGVVGLPAGRHRFGPRFAAAGTGCVVGAGNRLLRFDAAAPTELGLVVTDATDAALSADGSALVTSHPDGTVGVWDAGGVRRQALDVGFTKADPPVSVDVSGDGLTAVAGSAGGRVAVWDL